MNSKRTGRPRSFDLDRALAAALSVFRSKGYEGASLSSLTAAMGISPPSLYAAFGDKRGLYLRAIDHYMDNNACTPLIAFESESDIKRAVRAFLSTAIDDATDQPAGQEGCFLSSCVAASTGEVDGAGDRLRAAIEDADTRIATRFKAEKTEGNLPANFPALERARLMLDMRQGHVLRARAGFSAKVMKADLAYRVEAVLG